MRAYYHTPKACLPQERLYAVALWLHILCTGYRERILPYFHLRSSSVSSNCCKTALATSQHGVRFAFTMLSCIVCMWYIVYQS